MEKLIQFIQAHAQHAHYFLFGASLLAGLNLPVSIDLLMILAAVLAAAIIPEHLFHLFFSMFFGCLFSAWIAYWIGRKLGPRILKLSFFSKFIGEKQLLKVKKFYGKRGPFALIIGRFIPFGVRNALFMSSGMGGMSFRKFIFWDGLACFLWSITSFSIYFTLGKNLDVIYSKVKIINLLIFIAFAVALIGYIWYKKKKKVRKENV